VGNADDDILIAGFTDFDQNTHDDYGGDRDDGAGPNEAALCAVLREWTRTDASYATRVCHLRNGGGLNGSFTLTDATVHDDGAQDVLTGSAGQDWFFANLDGGCATRDRITDLSGREFADDIDFILS
jgi:hypothetical protein